MTRQNVRERCRGICAGYNEKRVCGFADNDSLLGFIDTSQGQNGTRGIAFAEEYALINFDGESVEVRYDCVKNAQIISSFEDFFADELLISYSDGDEEKELRISDFSLDKSELKRLLDELCGRASAKKPPSEKTGGNSSKSGVILPREAAELPRKTSAPTRPSSERPERPRAEQQYTMNENVARLTGKKLIRPEAEVLPEKDRRVGGAAVVTAQPRVFGNERRGVFDNVQAPAAPVSPKTPEPRVNIQPDDYGDIVFENRAPVITETVVNTPTRTTVIERERSVPQEPKRTADPPRDEFEDESAERLRIQNMTPEETLSYLSRTLNEINAPAPRIPEPRASVREDPPAAQTPQRAAEEAVPAENRYEKLTEEPIWGDIYIKASRNLRELCESGRLSMEQIEAELNDKLLDSARAFAKITADESKIPKVLIPKITELREAARNFDTYFQSGEDIAVRAMFFMLYQMLSYADRIVETPETKERLNDFFRRFGSAGITLSMLDMRV